MLAKIYLYADDAKLDLAKFGLSKQASKHLYSPN